MDPHVSQFEARMDRFEALLGEIEGRLAALERRASPDALPVPGRRDTGDPVEGTPALRAAAVSATVRQDAGAPAEGTAALKTAAPEPAPDADESPLPLALIGRTLIVLGGGYLLRALTDSHAIPVAAGIVAGLVYGLFWLVMAARAPRMSATFHGIAAVAISFPLIWEGTARFAFFKAESSALTVTFVALVALVVAWSRSLHALAWVVTLGALAATLMLMGSTSEVIPFVWTLSALGAGTLWLGYDRRWHLLRWPVAGLLDIVVAGLTVAVVTKGEALLAQPTLVAQILFFTTYVASFAARTLIRERDVSMFEILQSGAVLAIGFGGSVWLAQSNTAIRSTLALAGVLFGASCYAVAYAFARRLLHSSRNFVFYSSLGLALVLVSTAVALHAAVASIVWAALAVIAAWCATHLHRRTLAIHAAAYLAAASIGSGLVSYGGHALLASAGSRWPGLTFAMAICLAAAGALSAMPFPREESRRIRTAKMTVVTLFLWGAAGLAVTVPVLIAFGGAGPAADAGVVATIRTAVLSAAALALALAAQRFPIAKAFVYPVLVAGAAKLTFEDFRVGRPSTLFIALAIYGGALVLAPRFRRRKPVVPNGETTHELQNHHRAVPDQIRRDDQIHHA